MEKFSKFNKRRAFNKAVGPGKNPKLINVGPTFIPDYIVGLTLHSVKRWTLFETIVVMITWQRKPKKAIQKFITFFDSFV